MLMEFVTRNSLDGRMNRRTDKRNSNISELSLESAGITMDDTDYRRML